MKKENNKPYQTPKTDKLIVECCGYLFLFGILAGIWIDSIRWKAIFTAFLFLLIAIVFVISDNQKEKRYNEQK